MEPLFNEENSDHSQYRAVQGKWIKRSGAYIVDEPIDTQIANNGRNGKANKENWKKLIKGRN